VAFNGPRDESSIQKIFHREEVLDNIQQEIVTFLTEAPGCHRPHAIAEEGRQQFRIAHEYESMSDRLASILRHYAPPHGIGVVAGVRSNPYSVPLQVTGRP
jgi:hypothetical protein